MKYLCMVFIDEARMNASSEAARQELDRQSLAYDESGTGNKAMEGRICNDKCY